jgi:hypothetical protein
VQALDRQLQDRDAFLTEIRDRLLHAQELMKRQYDRVHRPLEFAVGDWVWMRLHLRLAASLTGGAARKLARKFYGPYKILERIGSLAYRLDLPPRARIHNVFHVVFLKKFEGTPPDAVVPLPPLHHGRVVPLPDRVLKARLNRGNWELLVRWQGHPPADSTWERLDEFKEAHPDFQLEDELFAGEGGSVMDAFYGWKFERRNKRAPVQE